MKKEQEKLKSIELKNKTEIKINLDPKEKIYKLLYKHLRFILPIITLVLISIFAEKFHLIARILWLFNLAIPLIFAIIFAWLLYPLRLRLEKFRINKVWATIIIALLTIGILTLIILIAIPILIKEGSEFSFKTYEVLNSITMDEFITRITETLNKLGFNVTEKKVNEEFFSLINTTLIMIREFSKEAPMYIVTSLTNATKSILSIFLGFSMSIFLLMDFERFSAFIPLMFKKKRRNDGKILLTKMNEVARGYVSGTLLIGVIVAAATAISLQIAGVPGAIILGLICGVTNLIPYIGPFIGAVPVIIVATFVNIKLGIIGAIIILVIQQIDGNLLKPILLGKTTKLHPVFIIFGLIIGGAIAGLIGMLIITPIIAMIKVIIEHYDNEYDFFERKEEKK